MKCKHCNGTGATNWYVNRAFVTCPYCGGTGEMEGNMTNEEWFCGLPAEEKARFIARYGIRRQVLHSFETVGDSIQKSTDRHLGTTDIYEPIEEWLKQPHKGE